MFEAALVKPDVGFIQDVISSGGDGLKKCMQCGTCSAVCALSPEDGAFPRKQMFAAQWGLRERVVNDPAMWLCHNCGDCSARCPRGARPGDVFGALRQQAIAYFATPQLLAQCVQNPKALWALFLLPGLIFAAIAAWAPKSEPTEALEFANLYPILMLEALFFGVAAIVLVNFGLGLNRFMKALKASGAGRIALAGLMAAVVEIMTHERFSKCEENERRMGHLLTFWGFVGLAVMGTIVGIGSMVGIMHTPLELGHPLKIFGNVSAVVALVGALILLRERLKNPARDTSTYFDWWFLLTLTAVLLTGILSELLRLTQSSGAMYGIYSVHLVLVFSLFLYAPYTKFAHFVYRTVAMAAVKGIK